jgi:phosphatidylcholine synthase
MTTDGVLARTVAWSVHLWTALGAVCGLLALHATGQGRFQAAWIWVGVALLIDGVDGTLARRAEVARRLPGFDGARLDDLVDFLNYAIVPTYLMIEMRLLPVPAGWVAAVAVCLASAYQFGQRDSKTPDGYFRGFPSYWNLVVFYLTLLRPAPWLAFLIVVSLALLSFVPSLYVYPTRTRELRALTLALTAAWGAVLGALILVHPDRPVWLVWLSLVYPAYYFGLSIALHTRHSRERGASTEFGAALRDRAPRCQPPPSPVLSWDSRALRWDALIPAALRTGGERVRPRPAPTAATAAWPAVVSGWSCSSACRHRSLRPSCLPVFRRASSPRASRAPAWPSLPTATCGSRPGPTMCGSCARAI